MFGSVILDVAIGTIFVFLAASLTVSAVNELLASLFRWRASFLEEGVRRLLDGDAGTRTFSDAIQASNLIKGLVREKGAWPSYLPSRTFALAFLQQIGITRGKATVAEMRATIAKGDAPAAIKEILDALLTEVEADARAGVSDVAKLIEGVERWFDDMMDRVGGWYKRWTKAVSFAIALVIVGATNLDSIAVVQTLARDPAIRQALAAQTTQLVEKPPVQLTVTAPPSPAPLGSAASPAALPGASPAASPAAPPSPAEVVASYQAVVTGIGRIEGLGFPIGWAHGWFASATTLMWLRKIVGLLLTAFAATLGAPFWFDLLSKVVAIRGAGKAPAPKTKPPMDATDDPAS